MTSNVGSKFIEKETSFGFVDAKRADTLQYEGMKAKLQDELRREFKPEFLNRIDDVVIFKTLTKDHIGRIIDIMLGDVQTRLKEKNIQIKVDKRVKAYLVDKGFDSRQGARPLRRSVQEHFEDRLADTLLRENLRTDVDVKASLRKDGIHFVVTKIAPLPKVAYSAVAVTEPALVRG